MSKTTPLAKTPSRTRAVPAGKSVVKPAKKPSAKPAAGKRVEAADHDVKVVRDGFTMPQGDYDTLKTLKALCLAQGVDVKKSEVLRAGVQALAQMPAKDLFERIRALPPVKAGRKKNKR